MLGHNTSVLQSMLLVKVMSLYGAIYLQAIWEAEAYSTVLRPVNCLDFFFGKNWPIN